MGSLHIKLQSYMIVGAGLGYVSIHTGSSVCPLVCLLNFERKSGCGDICGTGSAKAAAGEQTGTGAGR